MSGAKSTGADKSAGDGKARSREHNQGNQGRTYTTEQAAAVIRIRKCTDTAYYDILGLEAVRATAGDADIKRAYRKQSLLTHPDKNGHEHADEAFKMVSNAFGVLGDKDKREKFDKYGVDPDSRFASQQAQNNPFARPGGFGGGFPRRPGGGGNHAWEEELTPEEMFQRFFGGAPFGGNLGGGLDNFGPFVFNMGGGPGFRVHTFGGPRPRTRPRQSDQQQQNGPQQPRNNIGTLLGLLPVLLFFILPFLTSLFSGSGSTAASPRVMFDKPHSPYTHGRTTERLGVRYFVNPSEVAGYSPGAFSKLDTVAEQTLISHLDRECRGELLVQQRMREDAQGFWRVDREKLDRANAHPRPSCDRLRKMGVST